MVMRTNEIFNLKGLVTSNRFLHDIVATTNFYLHYFEINVTFDTGTE
jgi:hypothetical protein